MRLIYLVIVIIIPYLSIVAFGFLVMHYLANIFRSILVIKRLRAKVLLRYSSRNIAILIPVYEEKAVVSNTIHHFYKLSKKLNIDIYIITTDKELVGGVNDTRVAAEKTIKQANLGGYIKIINYDLDKGYKAEQLNFAMKNLKDEYEYFGIFDADSKPSIQGVDYIQRYPEENIDIFQMPSKYVKSQGSNLSRALAIFQNRWSYCFEIIKWNCWQEKKRPYMYLVGHGLFVKKGLRFPTQTITEDIDLGYHLSLKEKSLVLVPYFDTTPASASIRTDISQTIRWSSGEIFMLNKVLYALNFRITVRFLQVLLWPFGIFFVTYSLISLLLTNSLFGILLISFLIIFYVIILNELVRVICKDRFSFILYPYYLFKVVTNWIGPVLCIYRRMLHRHKEQRWD